VLIVAGKGGVGKTTVSAALACLASRHGLSTLILEIEGTSGLAAAFGQDDRLSYEESVLRPAVDGHGEIRARTLTPDDALIEYLKDHGMGRISKRLTHSGALDVVATAVPGIRDILVLGKVKGLERAAAADLIVLDAPAAGHAVSFLMSARGLLDAARVGPIQSQATEVIALLTDPKRSQVLLVTLPEETPVNEVVDTAFQLEDRVGVKLAGVVVNGLYATVEGLDTDPVDAAASAGASLRPGEADTLRAAARFRLDRQRLQEEQVGRLTGRLPLPQLRVPFLFTTDVGPAEVQTLSAALGEAVQELTG